MTLYHGTNKRFKNLKTNSFLSKNILDAVHYAERKGDGFILKFEVDDTDVIRDNTPQADWYINLKKLQPVSIIIS